MLRKASLLGVLTATLLTSAFVPADEIASSQFSILDDDPGFKILADTGTATSETTISWTFSYNSSVNDYYFQNDIVPALTIDRIVVWFDAGSVSGNLSSLNCSGANDFGFTCALNTSGNPTWTFTGGSIAPGTIFDVNVFGQGNNHPAQNGTTVHVDVSGSETTNSTAPVPEPASMALLGTGLLSVCGLVRRRR